MTGRKIKKISEKIGKKISENSTEPWIQKQVFLTTMKDMIMILFAMVWDQK